MKRIQIIFALVVLALGATASTSAMAWRHGGHVRFGVFVGPGFWYPPPYYAYPPYYPPYYYPPVVAAPVPQTYVEQGVAPSAPAPGSWYYCDGSKAYYPYVKECPGGWQRVAPQPAN
jgi:hypothetical protein